MEDEGKRPPVSQPKKVTYDPKAKEYVIVYEDGTEERRKSNH